MIVFKGQTTAAQSIPFSFGNDTKKPHFRTAEGAMRVAGTLTTGTVQLMVQHGKGEPWVEFHPDTTFSSPGAVVFEWHAANNLRVDCNGLGGGDSVDVHLMPNMVQADQ